MAHTCKWPGCCEQPPDAPVTLASPVPLVGVFEVETPKLLVEEITNFALPIPRRHGYYPAILGVGYARDGGGVPLAVPLHPVRIAFEQLDDAGLVVPGGAKYVLVDREIRFFSILSDGERSVCPPFVGGGADPFGLVLSYIGGEFPGQLRCYFRYMPRSNAYPGLR